MTTIAVLSDSVIHPFYPQYLSAIHGVRDPAIVGTYIACMSLVVALTFPLWARASRRVHPMDLLIATQTVTCVLSLGCALGGGLAAFWILSMVLMAFKASYLLIYPYVMSIEEPERHEGTIGLLAIVVYFGNILAALLGGAIFQATDPRLLFVGMAFGDALQLALCVQRRFSKAHDGLAQASLGEVPSSLSMGFLFRLGAVMFVMYFAAYLPEPFFSAHWERLAESQNHLLSGLVFAIPGLSALVALYAASRREGQRDIDYGGVIPATFAVIVALWLEAEQSLGAVIAGRTLYGWSIFQIMVRMDSLLFSCSTRESYAVEFSKANLFQGLGVLAASLFSGISTSYAGAAVTFKCSAGGFLAGGLLYACVFRRELWPARFGKASSRDALEEAMS
jgi:predicted MFS family arabinose efflux permease